MLTGSKIKTKYKESFKNIQQQIYLRINFQIPKLLGIVLFCLEWPFFGEKIHLKISYKRKSFLMSLRYLLTYPKINRENWSISLQKSWHNCII